jgi:hypothetical protein
MMEQALLGVKDLEQRESICTVACVVSGAKWQHWQAWRLPQGNRQEHEWIVFANVMRIAESEKLSLAHRRIATAFCFVHDTCLIKRIMEIEIDRLKEKGLSRLALDLTKMKMVFSMATILAYLTRKKMGENREHRATKAPFQVAKIDQHFGLRIFTENYD